jgi:hypothetical protein
MARVYFKWPAKQRFLSWKEPKPIFILEGAQAFQIGWFMQVLVEPKKID